MSRRHVVLIAALLLASCGSQEPTTAQNRTADGEANALGSARPTADPGRPAVDGMVGPAPPPETVSRPDGDLPEASDAPAPAEHEPTAADPPRPGEPPPATEDEYIHRNKQAGR